jgi:predicted esterase
MREGWATRLGGLGWAASLLVGPIASAESPEPIPAGVVIQSVPVAGDPGQSYSLYVPSSYHAGKKWPVLFAFDPGARGTMPVECFRQAAEEYGYVVAGSNTSRNGPLGVSIKAGAAMIDDVGRRLSIDERRFYTTGFSGGARVACAMGRAFAGMIAGVIGCGAGYPSQAEPTADDPFVFCGVVGNRDFNWVELNRLDRTLGSLGLPHRTLRFAGGHQWPPPETARASIEWLELQAMRSGRRPRDGSLVARWLQQELDLAQAREAAGELAEAWSGYVDLVAAFDGLLEIGPYRAKVASLGDHKLVKAAQKREREEEAVETHRMNEIQGMLLNLEDPEQRFEKRGVLLSTLARLAGDEKSARTESGKLLARRLLEHASVTAFYAAQSLIEAERFAAAVPYLETQVAIHPQSAEAQYRLAAASARAGDKRQALEALEAAVSHGLEDAPRIEGDEAFAGLRKDRRFLELLERLKAERPAG